MEMSWFSFPEFQQIFLSIKADIVTSQSQTVQYETQIIEGYTMVIKLQDQVVPSQIPINIHNDIVMQSNFCVVCNAQVVPTQFQVKVINRSVLFSISYPKSSCIKSIKFSQVKGGNVSRQKFLRCCKPSIIFPKQNIFCLN